MKKTDCIIEELTPEQEALMDVVVEEMVKSVLGGDDSVDRAEVEKGIAFLYELADLKKPEIVYCSSPWDMAVKAELKPGETIDYFGCGYDSGWVALCDYMERIGVDVNTGPEYDKWYAFTTKSGCYATCLYERIAFVCPRPSKASRNAAGDLHCTNGPAIAWADGYEEYMLNGVSVSKELVMTPAEKIDVGILLKETNAEIRREIVRKVGIERVVQKLGAEVIDKSGEYELLLIDLKDGRKREYLKMKNPSIGVYHIEGVRPGIKTVAEALSYRNGIDTPPAKLT